MSEKEIEVYGKQVDEIKIRPYEHHAKYYETDQMGIIHHSNYQMDGRGADGSDGSDRTLL